MQYLNVYARQKAALPPLIPSQVQNHPFFVPIIAVIPPTEQGTEGAIFKTLSATRPQTASFGVGVTAYAKDARQNKQING